MRLVRLLQFVNELRTMAGLQTFVGLMILMEFLNFLDIGTHTTARLLPVFAVPLPLFLPCGCGFSLHLPGQVRAHCRSL